MQTLERPLDAYALVSDPELRRAAAKTLKGFCLTYLPHHFPLDPSDFFDDMCRALEDHVLKRVEMIGFRGCAKFNPRVSRAPAVGRARISRAIPVHHPS